MGPSRGSSEEDGDRIIENYIREARSALDTGHQDDAIQHFNKAFAIIFRDYEATIIRYCQYYLSMDKKDAEDMAHTIFLGIWRNLPDFRLSSSIRTWIFRIIRNKFNDHIGWIIKERNLRSSLSLEPDMSTHYDSLEEDEKRLKICLQKLPPKFREIIVMRFIVGETIKHVSDFLGVPISAINRRQRSALQQLKTCMEDSA